MKQQPAIQSSLSAEAWAKQQHYRDARFTDQYDNIWQSVGKCVFCDLRDKYIFFEEHGVVMTVSLFAYIDGHFMIVPRRHVRSPKELSQLEWDTVRKFSYIAKKLIKDVHSVKGMQLVQKDGSSAQSTVDQHLHFHCIPFDAPDLSVWNYRQLKYTPLESAHLYREAGKKIIRAGLKFDDKYKQPDGLPIVCDLVLINDRREVLLVKRHRDAIILPPHDTTPGGHVDDYDRPLETELAREVHEETGLQLDSRRFRLVASRIDKVLYQRHSAYLSRRYAAPHQFLWNTYSYEGLPAETAMRAGDDAVELYWLPLAKVAAHPALTPAIRDAISRAAA